MKKFRKIIALALCFMMCTTPIMANAATLKDEPIIDEHITMDDINSSETKIIYISDETIYTPDPSEMTTLTTGDYPISTRMITKQSSSNGTIQKSSKTGLLASIAATALSFISGIKAMTVSTILSVVGIAASEDQYVQARTYISYVDYEKHGQAKWANESSYSTWVISGKRNYYKHVLGGKKNSSGVWTTYTKDYTSSPAKTLTGNYYNKSTTWFKDQAYQRIQSDMVLFDTPY